MRIIHARVASRIALGIVLATLLAAAQANHYILPCGDEPCTPDGSATDIAIGSPGAVTTDSHGNVYFSSPSLVYRLDTRGRLSRIAGSSTSGFAGDGGPAADALLNFPATYPELEADPIDWSELVGGLAADAAGNVYIADAYNHRVRKVDVAGAITTFADKVGWPVGVALSGDGELVVSELFGSVYRFAPSGSWVVLTSANCGHRLDPGVCVPTQPAIDGDGNVLVGDGYCRVRQIGRNGTVGTIAGNDARVEDGVLGWDCGYSGDGGRSTLAALAWPYAVAVDRDNNVIIADTYNNCIRKVDRNYIITTFAGQCTQGGFDGDGGAATSALLCLPHGVAVDPNGNVYIADTCNNRIRKVGTNGVIETIAGNGDAVPDVLPAVEDPPIRSERHFPAPVLRRQR